METRFEITFQETVEMYGQLFRRLYSRRYIAYAMGFVAFALWMGYQWYLTKSILYSGLMIVFLIGAVWYLCYPKNMAEKNYKKRVKMMRGTQTDIHVRFGEEEIHMAEDGSSNALSYNRIAKFYFENEIMIFIMDYKSAFFVPYEGLVGGKKDDLMNFLIEKCPTAKFYV